MPIGAYAKPPIVEAIVELRFKAEPSRADREKVGELFARSHPAVEKRVVHEIEVRGDGAAQIKYSDDGTFVRRSADATDAVIVTRQAVGFARQAPYDGWDNFRRRSIAGWAKVAAAIGRKPLSRLGVRFQNRIDVPGRDVSILDVLRVSTEPISEIGGSVATVKQTALVLLPAGMKANVIYGTAESALIDHTSIGLDIDVYDDNWSLPRDDAIAARLDELRAMKNRMFEAYITERARMLFDSN